MDQNNKNSKKPGRSGKGSNWQGLIQVICWAGVLAILLSYAGNYMSGTGNQASSVELEYSEFQDMAASGLIEDITENVAHMRLPAGEAKGENPEKF